MCSCVGPPGRPRTTADSLSSARPISIIGCDVEVLLHRLSILIVLSTVTTTPPSSAMRILTCVGTFAVALIALLFPVPCAAQIAVPLTIPLPLEVRSPYLNFWTRASSWSLNTATSAGLFFAEAVSHVTPRFLSIYLHFRRLAASPSH
jgi:hypothetical protein